MVVEDMVVEVKDVVMVMMDLDVDVVVVVVMADVVVEVNRLQVVRKGMPRKTRQTRGGAMDTELERVDDDMDDDVDKLGFLPASTQPP